MIQLRLKLPEIMFQSSEDEGHEDSDADDGNESSNNKTTNTDSNTTDAAATGGSHLSKWDGTSCNVTCMI